MNKPSIPLPELDWSQGGVLSAPFMQKYLDAVGQTTARGQTRLQRAVGSLQRARSRFTAGTGRVVVKATASPALCASLGHQIVARPWVEIPGHYENWHRLVGCRCGKVLHLQSCNNHQDPALSFLPKKEPKL